MAMPLTGGGFGAAIVAAKPDRNRRFFADAVVFAMRRRWDHWPTFEDVAVLTPADAALFSHTSMISVRDGRWRVLGYLDHFDATEWAWPGRWRKVEEGAVEISVSNDLIVVNIDTKTLQLDPLAEDRRPSMSTYSSIELDTARIIYGTHLRQDEAGEFADEVVTPEKLAAWQAINRAIDCALAG